jgi:hypothetical protein
MLGQDTIELAALCLNPKKLDNWFDCQAMGKTIFPEKYDIQKILQSIEDNQSNAFALTKTGAFEDQVIRATKDASGVWIVVVYDDFYNQSLRRINTAYPFALQDDKLVEAYFRIKG